MKKNRESSCEQCAELFPTLFSNLDNADLSYINERKISTSFNKGHCFFEVGQKPTGIYCLKEGKVKIARQNTEGREHIIRIVLPGELIGIQALVSGTDYAASAIVIEDATVCFIHKNDFFQLLIKYPAITNTLISELSKQLTEAESKLASLANKPVRERLAESLLYLHKSFHLNPKNPDKSYLNLTRMDLANIIATAPETVIRLLSEFKDDRLISMKGRKIFLLNLSLLEKIANLKS